MLAAVEREKFAKVCSAIGNEVAGDDGFVAVRSLLTRFQAQLFIRPLLVEGMLARISGPSKWAVLIDSETHFVGFADVEAECLSKPLPSRFRNTVAHELVHSLAFRTSEFGARLEGRGEKYEGSSDLVKDIEQETETLSPLLLLPEKSLIKLLSTKTASLRIDDVLRISQIMGLSREVLINRLDLLPASDEHRFRRLPALRNTAIGIAEWLDKKVAILKKWPLFANFDDNLFPDLVVALAKRDLSAVSAIANERFSMCGGWEDTVEITNSNMPIQISMESVGRERGKQFLFVVNKSQRGAS